MKKYFIFLLLIWLSLGVAVAQDENATPSTRNPPPPAAGPNPVRPAPLSRPVKRPSSAPVPSKQAPKGTNSVRVTRTAKPAKAGPETRWAGVSFSTSPDTGTIQIAGESFSRLIENGTLRIGKLRPGTYRATVHSDNYRDQNIEFTLRAGEIEQVEVILVRQVGYLSITPNVKRVSISLNGMLHSGALNNIVLSPGRYLVEASKPGFYTETAEVYVTDNEIRELNLTLRRIPPPRTGDTMRLSTQSGKDAGGNYNIITISGTSGEMNAGSGVLNLEMIPEKKLSSVQGMLSGLPCSLEISFLENVKQAVWEQIPEAANNWGGASVRLYPRDRKKKMRVSLLWHLLNEDDADTNLKEAVNSSFKEYVGTTYRLTVPAEWRVPSNESDTAFAPPNGVVYFQGRNEIIRGVQIVAVPNLGGDLTTRARAIVSSLLGNNTYLRQTTGFTAFKLASRQGLTASLAGTNPATGKTELVNLFFVTKPDDRTFYIATVCPRNEQDIYTPLFNIMLSTFTF